MRVRGDAMKILTIDPRREMIVRSIPIVTKDDARRFEDHFKADREERGDLDRVIIAGGTVRIMDPADPVPVPMQQPEGRYAAGNLL